MWESIVLSAAAVAHGGKSGKENGGNFYLNGQYMIDTDFGNVRTSMENSGSQFLFAVCQDMGNQSKEASGAIIGEMKRLNTEYEGSIISIEERARQVQECFDVTSNLLKIFESTKKPMFSAVIVYHMKVSVYGVGKGSVLLYRNKAITAPDHLSGFELKVGDTFLMADRVLLEKLGAEVIEHTLSTAKTATEAVNMFYTEIIGSDYADDINLVVVKAVKTASEMPVGVKDDIAEQFEPDEQQDYSKKLVKYYDKKQETLRTIIASVLTIIILLAVVFTVYKILTGSSGDDKSVITNKTTVAASITPGKSATTGTSGTASASSTAQTTASASATPSQTGEYTLYTIKSGDTLVSICGEYYKDESKYVKVMEFNGITDATKIQVGQVIKLPKL